MDASRVGFAAYARRLADAATGPAMFRAVTMPEALSTMISPPPVVASTEALAEVIWTSPAPVSAVTAPPA